MKRVNLTKRFIDGTSFTSEGQLIYWDDKIPGFGLRVGTRSKVFILQVSVKDSTKKSGYKSVKHTIGRYGDLTLDEARNRIFGRQENGVFIPGLRLELKELNNIGGEGRKITLKGMLDAYYSERKTKAGHEYKQSTIDGAKAIFEYIFPTWLPLTLPEINKFTPSFVIERYKEIEASNGPYAARNAFILIKAVIGYAKRKYPSIMTNNPFEILTSPDMSLMKKIRSREECLKGTDFKQFYEGLQGFEPNIRDAFLFCLYTGMRRAEVENLTWPNIDLEKKTLFVDDTKNRNALFIPLSEQSLEILTRRKQFIAGDNNYVFSTLKPHLSKKGHVQLSALILKHRTGLNITVHGLRRSFITIGRKLKLHTDTDLLTNHVDSSISGKYYDQTNIDDLRKPSQMIADEIERLMDGTSATVIHFPIAEGTR
jgi:integrase